MLGNGICKCKQICIFLYSIISFIMSVNCSLSYLSVFSFVSHCVLLCKKSSEFTLVDDNEVLLFSTSGVTSNRKIRHSHSRDSIPIPVHSPNLIPFPWHSHSHAQLYARC